MIGEASSAAPARHRLQRHGLIVEASVALGVLTLLILTIPGLHFSVRWAGGRQSVAAAAAAISLLTSLLAYLWYSVTGSRSTLYVAAAFMILSLNQLLFGVLVPPGLGRVAAERSVYLWMSGRLVAAVLLLMAATHRDRDDPPAAHPVLVFVGTLCVATAVLTALQWAIWSDVAHLPRLCCIGAGRLLSDGLTKGVTPAAIGVALLGAALYLYAAVRFRADPNADPDGQRYPRGDWLSLALVFAAFSHIHYLLAPTVFSERIATGDVLRIASFAVLFIGLLWEVRLLLQQERDRTMQVTAMNEMKLEVSRIVTHDLLHSIATLRAFSFLLDDRWDHLDDERRRASVGKIDRQAKRLGALADDTVAALGSATDRIELRTRPEPVGDLVREAADIVDRLDGRLLVHLEDGPETVALVDHDAVVRVLLNLLWNAEEHSPADRPVEIAVTHDDVQVIVSVIDEGPGFPADDGGSTGVRRVAAPSAAKPGWGVGLRRSRAVVEAHGGRLWMGGAPGRGTAVSVGLPRNGTHDD